MKKITPVKHTPSISTFKKSYCITIKNAGKKTQGGLGKRAEHIVVFINYNG